MGTGAILAVGTLSFAQDKPHIEHAQHMHGNEAIVPTMPGQQVFGAIQEIVRILEADPATDWSKVNISALREHLIDMDEVTMRATALKEPIENGLRIKVTGSDRTLAAVQRMVPEHARDIDGMYGWTVRTTTLPNGVELTTTASNPVDVQKIRALGFMGIMVQGSHHQMHHLAMVKGEPMHMH
jgi:predicted RNA binding protein YcfA (HicA-like mRNA interferase family)